MPINLDGNLGVYTSGNVSATGNVTGAYILGNGALLTGVAASYGNANVEAYLPTSPTIIAINANVANTNANVANNTSNITTLQGQVYANANVAAYLPTYTGTLTATNVNVSNTVTATLFVGNFQGNITGNLVVPGVDGEVLFNDGGNAGGDAGLTFNKTTNDLTVGNLVTANSFLGNGMTINGNVFITGNANIQGNLTYNNITNLTTSNLVLGLGNNQTGINVTGGGIAVGNTNEATLLYNFTTQAWDSNLGIDATGNVTAPYFIGDGSQLTGIIPQAEQANTANLATLATTATSATTAATVTTNAQPNITSVGILSSLSATGNVTGNYFIGDGSLLTGITASYGNANVADYLPTYTGDLTANNATFLGTVTADGNTNATAFAVVGNGAASNVALGFFPTGNTPAQMAIRDHSIVASSIYFDASAGGSANGVFNFRTSNAFTSYASLSNTGLTVNSTQTSNTNVNSTVYYNTGTSQLTAGPSMAAFANVSAPFTGNITTANMGHWFQAQGNIVLPQYTTVPVGTTFTITNSAGSNVGPLRVTVFNTGSDFIYYPPQFGNTTRYVEMFFGQWMTLVSRGTGEWDVVASNISETQKVSAYTFNNTPFSLDLMNFRYDGTHTQFSPVSGSFTVAGQTLDMVPGQGPASATFASNTYNAGTWYNLSGVASITTAGSTSQSFLYATNGTYTRSYRVTFMIVSNANVYITVERLVAA